MCSQIRLVSISYRAFGLAVAVFEALSRAPSLPFCEVDTCNQGTWPGAPASDAPPSLQIHAWYRPSRFSTWRQSDWTFLTVRDDVRGNLWAGVSSSYKRGKGSRSSEDGEASQALLLLRPWRLILARWQVVDEDEKTKSSVLKFKFGRVGICLYLLT